ncbi:MAG: phosphohistidine phosphatase SixA [Longimicrobiales bacterium]
MNILVVRHAIAEDAAAWAATGEPDERRPLTDEGRKKMRKGARGLRALVRRIDLLATSPLVRAVQTAEVVAREYDALAVTVSDVLAPGRQPGAFLEWLRSLDQVGTLAVVGHDPHLPALVSWLLTGQEGGVIELKKGGACLLQLEPAGAPGNALLSWLLTPDQLRALRK